VCLRGPPFFLPSFLHSVRQRPRHTRRHKHTHKHAHIHVQLLHHGGSLGTVCKWSLAGCIWVLPVPPTFSFFCFYFMGEAGFLCYWRKTAREGRAVGVFCSLSLSICSFSSSCSALPCFVFLHYAVSYKFIRDDLGFFLLLMLLVFQHVYLGRLLLLLLLPLTLSMADHQVQQISTPITEVGLAMGIQGCVLVFGLCIYASTTCCYSGTFDSWSIHLLMTPIVPEICEYICVVVRLMASCSIPVHTGHGR
jgi:hypothetical protein